jgi:hypothetical protein
MLTNAIEGKLAKGRAKAGKAGKGAKAGKGGKLKKMKGTNEAKEKEEEKEEKQEEQEEQEEGGEKEGEGKEDVSKGRALFQLRVELGGLPTEAGGKNEAYLKVCVYFSAVCYMQWAERGVYNTICYK